MALKKGDIKEFYFTPQTPGSEMVLSSSVGSEAQTSFNSKGGLNGGGGGGRAYSKKDMEEALDALREKRLSLTRYSVSKNFGPSPWY